MNHKSHKNIVKKRKIQIWIPSPKKNNNSRNKSIATSKVDRYFEIRSLGKSYSMVTSIVSLGRTPEIRSNSIERRLIMPRSPKVISLMILWILAEQWPMEYIRSGDP